MRFRSFAKVNLTLDILGKDKKQDMHFLKTVYLKIPLFDEIEIIPNKTWEFEFFTDKDYLKEDIEKIDLKNNIFHKVLEHYEGKEKYLVRVKKRIPVESGLGGASSNAAVLLKFLKLENKAKEIGADVSSFLYDEILTLGENFGEKVHPLKIREFPFKEIGIYIHKNKRIKTNKAFPLIDLKKCGKDTELTKKLIEGDLDQKYFHNDFLQIKKNRELQDILGKGFFLSGSGCTFFSFEYFGEIPEFTNLRLKFI